MKNKKTPVPAPDISPRTPDALKCLTVTETELAKAFTEWERRYREEPDDFLSEAKKLLTRSPETYGEACAPYLMQIIRELRA